jgi:hypothetical protein
LTEESFEKIDYRVRPAKCVERKLLVEALRCLERIAPISDWTYVGFGSVYFSDFILFRKALGIVDMYSIEKSKRNKDRFIYNKPYGYVGMLWGTAAQRLPDIDWSKRTITWLDYDRPLKGEVLADLAKVATSAAEGSVLLATVDVDPKRLTDVWLSELRGELGPGRVPRTLIADNLKGPRGPAIAWKLIDRAIRSAMRTRNLTNAPDVVEYRQLFHFVYDDSSRMLTVGGILLGQADFGPFRSSGMPDLWFVRPAESPLDIVVQKLTIKEMKALDRCLPLGPHSEGPPPSLPVGADEQYARIHRYFPTFVEADL